MVSMVQYKTRKLYLAQSTHASTRTTHVRMDIFMVISQYVMVHDMVVKHTLLELAENGILVK
jgi:hypothetical protein